MQSYLVCVFGEPFCGVTLPLTYAIRKKKIVYPSGIQIINLSVHLHSSLAIRVSFAFMRLESCGAAILTTPFIGYNSPIFRRLKNRPVFIFYGATCNVNWFTLLTAWSNNGVDNFARLLMLTPRSDWINSSSFGFVPLAPQRSLLFVQKASRGAGFFNAKQNFLSTQPLDVWSKV